MQIIVGLGNPGSEYSGTRHNIGFSILDRVAARLNAQFTYSPGEYLIGRKKAAEKEVILVKPQSYMNNSGLAVSELLNKYGSTPQDLLVVADDFYLPLGKVRFRGSGSSGGHNGLASIIFSLQTDNFPRLRCGIGPEAGMKIGYPASDFVLSTFDPPEREKAGKMAELAAEAIAELIMCGYDRAVQRFNNRQV